MYFHVNSFYTLEANPDSETRPGPEFTLDQSVCLFFLFFFTGWTGQGRPAQSPRLLIAASGPLHSCKALKAPSPALSHVLLLFFLSPLAAPLAPIS